MIAIYTNGLLYASDVFSTQDPALPEQTGQAARCVGATGKSKDEDAVTEAIVQTEKLIGFTDLPIEPLAQGASNETRRLVCNTLADADAVVIEDHLCGFRFIAACWFPWSDSASEPGDIRRKALT